MKFLTIIAFLETAAATADNQTAVSTYHVSSLCNEDKVKIN